MRAIVGRLDPWMVAIAAVAAVLCLLGPWVRSGQVDRSTLGLLRSASALDLLEGGEKAAAVGAWYALPVLAAGAVLAAGWGRRRLTGACALPMGLLMVLAVGALVSSPVDVRWAAWLGAVMGLTASVLGGLLLMVPNPPAEGNR